MKNRICRTIVFAYCTLMFSPAFSAGRDAMFVGNAPSPRAMEASLTRITALEVHASAEDVDQPKPPGSKQSVPTPSAPSSLAPLIEILRRTGHSADFAGSLAERLGIPLKPGEKSLKLQGRGFMDNSKKTLHGMHIPEDPSRDLVIFIVETARDIMFLVSSSAGAAPMAIWRERTGGWLPVSQSEVEQIYRAEVAYWEERLGVRAVPPVGKQNDSPLTPSQ